MVLGYNPQICAATQSELSSTLGYLGGFETAKTAQWLSRGLHHFGKFLEPSDEWAGRGCCCFLMWWHSWAFLAHQEWAPEICRAQICIFYETLSMSLRYFGNELHNRGLNTVIAFPWRDCAGFLFVGYWITHCVPCLGYFLAFILCDNINYVRR